MPESLIPAIQGRERLLSIMERANLVAGAPDTMKVIQGMLDLMVEITLAGSATFFQLDPETDEMIITAVQGDLDSQYLIGLRLNRQQGLPGITLNGSQPVVVGDLPSDPNWLRTIDPASAATKRNVINLPIIYNQYSYGLVQIFNYYQAELDLLLVLGDRLAIELKHRVQLDAAQRSKSRLQTLVEVIGEIAGTLDRNQLLHLVTENTARLVEAERSSIFLVHPETREMLFQVAYRTPAEENRTTSPAARPKNIPTGEPQHAAAHQPNDEFWYFSRSAITVPIHSDPLAKDHTVDRQHILGGLMALNKQDAAFQEEDAQLMQILANQASTFLQVAEMYESAGDLFLDVIKALAAAIDAKDPYTQGHSQRVSDYSVLISQELRLSEGLINDIRIGSLLHDIGKIGIPDAILLKEGKLTSEEYNIIKRHPTTGINILKQVKLLEPVLPAIAEHHERLDGSGYPAALNSGQISLMGRIVAVADVFDAMTSHRPYRPALTVAEVLSYLQSQAGNLFDPTCVAALQNIIVRANEDALA